MKKKKTNKKQVSLVTAQLSAFLNQNKAVFSELLFFWQASSWLHRFATDTSGKNRLQFTVPPSAALPVTLVSESFPWWHILK